MENTVCVRTYEPPEFDIKEIIRYTGAKELDGEMTELLMECIKEAEDKLIYKVCYREFPIKVYDEYIDLGFLKTASCDLRKNLNDAKSIVLFAATVGLGIDRLIARYKTVSPTKSLMFQAIGAERIESLCNVFCDELKKEKEKQSLVTKPRFSAGYGDFPLDVQKEIFSVLDAQKRVGITLNESLLMSPSKSVTAIVGICDFDTDIVCKSGCDACNKTHCEFRREK